MGADIPAHMASLLTKGLGSCRPTPLTALQREREEEVPAKLSARASSAATEPPCICFKDAEVSRVYVLSCGLTA